MHIYQKMIKYNISSKVINWNKRVKKIDNIVKNILIYKKDLKFLNDINYECNFVLANDLFVKKLNNKYKNINKCTDVLTFISTIDFRNKKKEKYCDIIFSIETIVNDSKKNKIDFYDHITHLIIHSFLHINNYIHDKINDYLKMKKIEIKVLKKLEIDNPY